MALAGDVDVERVLTVDQGVVDDPYPVWRALRETCPVFREPRFNVVVVTRYDDIVDVARRPQDFSSILAAYGPKGTDRGPVPLALCEIARRSGTPDAEGPGRVAELLDAYVPDIQDQLQHVDPPLHTRHRRIVSRWFTASAVELRADAIRTIATSLIDRFAEGGRVEILDALAGPLPATVVADVIGIPEDHRDVFLDWKEEVIGNPEVEFTDATSERYQRIREVFLKFIAARRAAPRDDMISTLVTARTRDGEALDDQAVLGLLLLFLGGGQETTGKAITSGVRLLAERPDLQADLRRQPEHLPTFIEEVLRYESPVKGIFRIATRDTEIGGTPVPEGSFIQLMWGSGNRDDTAFDSPDVFNAERLGEGRRPDRQTLAFGHGIHLCPGAPLARLQTRIVLEELLARFRSITLASGNDFRYFRSQILRGLAGLWVNLEPRGMSASGLGPADLVLSHYSLPTGTPFTERVAATTNAGFAGIGRHVREYAELRSQGWTDLNVRDVLDGHGIVLHEVDALALDRLGLLDDAVALTIAVGAHHLQAQGNRPGTVDEAARTVAAIADRVADVGASVAIEFLGCNNIATADDALEIAERSDRDNVGVQIDIWHHIRGANDWAMLEAIPPKRIASVQVDDGPLTPVDADYFTDTVHHRCAPGEGEFDLARFLAIFDGAKAPVPLSIEVLDDDLNRLPVSEAAKRIADGARQMVAAHGGGRRR